MSIHWLPLCVVDAAPGHDVDDDLRSTTDGPGGHGTAKVNGPLERRPMVTLESDFDLLTPK